MRRLLGLGDSLLIIAGIAAIAWSHRVQALARRHGILMYATVLILLALLGIMADQLLKTQKQCDDAEARYPKITRRDQELFDRIERELGRDTPATHYLEAIFDGKSW